MRPDVHKHSSASFRYGGRNFGAPTRVVELPCLANTQTAATNYKNLLDIDGICGSLDDSALQVGMGIWGCLCLIAADRSARKEADMSGRYAGHILAFSIKASVGGSGGEGSGRTCETGCLAEEGA